MQRDFRRLSGDPFDLLVVGGGIYGAWTAYDASLRGLRVALIEQADWAAFTSSASSKLIHGGLRYLEHGRLGLVRKGLAERKRLWKLAPHRVRPLRFVLPVYRGARVRRWKLGVGLWLYDALARRSSQGRHESLSRGRLLERYGFLDPEDLSGGFTFVDSQTDDARFVLEIVSGAARSGAVAVNRAEAVELVTQGDRVRGARVRDLETGEELEALAEATIDCSGPWTGRLYASADSGPGSRLAKGIHLVLPRLPTEDAVLVPTESHGGVVFLIPWYGRTVVGTTDTEFHGDPARVGVEPADVDYLLGQANRVLGRDTWTPEDVISSFAGVRTLPADDGSTADTSREFVVSNAKPGLLASVGGKYTSARADAALLVDRAMEWLDRGHVPCATAGRPFPWRPTGSYRTWRRDTLSRALELGLEEAVAESCRRRFGTRVVRLFGLIRDDPDLRRRIVPDAPFCRAEIVLAVRDEMARSLEDVLRRRIPLTLVSRLDERTLRDAAELAGRVLDWSPDRRRDEVESLLGAGRPVS